MSTPPDGPFDLHLPAGTKDLFEKRIAEIPEDKRRTWRFHVVAPGDTLNTIAHTFHVSASQIAFVNQLDSGSDLSGTQALVIPVAPVSASASVRNERYRTRRGDTLVTVADRFNVTVDQLRRWNHLSSTRLKPGRRLYISEPAHVSRRLWRRRKSREAVSAAAHGRVRGKHALHANKSRLPQGPKAPNRPQRGRNISRRSGEPH
jgi:membrane-bound lytic murein transglycosylase D